MRPAGSAAGRVRTRSCVLLDATEDLVLLDLARRGGGELLEQLQALRELVGRDTRVPQSIDDRPEPERGARFEHDARTHDLAETVVGCTDDRNGTHLVEPADEVF